MYLEYHGYSWKWDWFTVFMDQIVALGTICLLSQAVRGVAKWLAPIGACSLGIYLGGDIVFYCPYGPDDKTGASFGIIVDKYQIMPVLQDLLWWWRGFWPAMVVAVFVYNIFQIFVFGYPFHQCYLKVAKKADNWMQPKKSFNTSADP